MTEFVDKYWIIYREPGCIPFVKIPTPNTSRGALDMLCEMIPLYAEGTHYTIAFTDWTGKLHVQDGREAMVIDESLKECADYG